MERKQRFLFGFAALLTAAIVFLAGCPPEEDSAPTKAATPTASPPSGTIPAGTQITLTTTTEGAVIFYTTDNTAPSTESYPYSDSSKPTLTSTTILKAIAIKGGMDVSDVMTVTYTIDASKVATPTASPASGAVEYGTRITLSTYTSGAEIYYTLDGSDPASLAASRYSSSNKPTITADTTLKAIARKEGMTLSDVLTAAYTVIGGSYIPPGGIQNNITGSWTANSGGYTLYLTITASGWTMSMYDSGYSEIYDYGTYVMSSSTSATLISSASNQQLGTAYLVTSNSINVNLNGGAQIMFYRQS